MIHISQLLTCYLSQWMNFHLMLYSPWITSCPASINKNNLLCGVGLVGTCWNRENRFETFIIFLCFLLCRLLWVLHQMFRRGALCIVGGYNPLLLWRLPVLWMWPRGSHRHRDHPGNPLLQGHQWPRHADQCVSVLLHAARRLVTYLRKSVKCMHLQTWPCVIITTERVVRLKTLVMNLCRLFLADNAFPIASSWRTVLIWSSFFIEPPLVDTIKEEWQRHMCFLCCHRFRVHCLI